MLAAAIGGVIAQAIGYQGVFIICIAIDLVSIAIVAREFDPTRRTQLTPEIEERVLNNIVSGCIGIIQSSQQSTVNSQQSTITDGVTGIDIKPSYLEHLEKIRLHFHLSRQI